MDLLEENACAISPLLGYLSKGHWMGKREVIPIGILFVVIIGMSLMEDKQDLMKSRIQ
jgi:hypothetical protein